MSRWQTCDFLDSMRTDSAKGTVCKAFLSMSGGTTTSQCSGLDEFAVRRFKISEALSEEDLTDQYPSLL